jgi:hypothetical protein
MDQARAEAIATARGQDGRGTLPRMARRGRQMGRGAGQALSARAGFDYAESRRNPEVPAAAIR